MFTIDHINYPKVYLLEMHLYIYDVWVMDPSIIIHHIGAPFSRSKRARKKRNFVASNHNFFASVLFVQTSISRGIVQRIFIALLSWNRSIVTY